MPSTRLPTALGSTALAALLLLPLTVQAQDAPVTQPVAATIIDGWGNLKFGMTIAEAKAASDMAWNPETCVNQQTIALRGCNLWADYGLKYGHNGAQGSYKITIDGMRFQPELGFDRRGRLERISLRLEEDVHDISTCQTYFQRTMDYLERRHGRFASRQETLHKTLADAGYSLQEHATPAGSRYYVSVNRNQTVFSSRTLTNDLTALEEAIEFSRTNSTHRASRAYIRSMFIMSGATEPNKLPRCEIDIHYDAAHTPVPQAAGGN